jgi:hypothetical protein
MIRETKRIKGIVKGMMFFILLLTFYLFSSFMLEIDLDDLMLQRFFNQH